MHIFIYFKSSIISFRAMNKFSEKSEIGIWITLLSIKEILLNLNTFFRKKSSTSDIDSEAKQSISPGAKKCQITDLKITGYNAKAVKILFEYIAGKPSNNKHFHFFGNQ